MKKKLFMAASLGNCVHVAGGVHFLNLAADEGYDTLFLGPAVTVEELMAQVRKHRPYLVSLGYRLTPENVLPLVRQIKLENEALTVKPRWVFGGTKPVARLVEQENFFERVFDGSEEIDECIAFLRGVDQSQGEHGFGDTLIERITQKRPYPLLRHHFGLPDYQQTLAGVAQIAEAKILDVISLGPDQNTQQYFFQPEKRDPRMDGAGGVPVASFAEFQRLRQAADCGNRPLMRCYSGTADVFRFAEVLRDSIRNAWCAVPLCWYNELDGRGDRPLEESIPEAQKLMAWHGQQNIPVEVNEPHHWGLRDAHDVISVVMAYISGYNAKKMGVKDYIAQYMFNVPGSMAFAMDLAKVSAQISLVESLADESFHIWREVRAGLPFLSSDLDIAKGQLASSTYLAMAVRPHIIHVVGYSEAEHAATPAVVIESCKIVRGVIRSVLEGAVNSLADPAVVDRQQYLLAEAKELLQFITSHYNSCSEDPLADPWVLSDCICRGILDAPHILKNEKFRGLLETRMIDGCCVAWDRGRNRPLCERERLEQLAAAGRFVGAPWQDASKKTVG